MKSKPISICSLAGCVTAAIFVLSSIGSAMAQDIRGTPPNINLKAEDQGRQMREGRLRRAELEALAESENEKLVQAIIVKMKEDFVSIQLLRNDIARNLVAHKPLDYNLISTQTEGIHKHASRLNVYMLAKVPDYKETDDTAELKSEGMFAALVRLCKLVDSFTENPVLKYAGSLDVKEISKIKADKARADGDLLSIIKLSERIKKQSDNLKAQQ